MEIKKVSLVFISFVFALLSIIGCYLIARTFFFDKFFYQKSVLYGYYPNTIHVNNTQFKNRSLSLRNLESNISIFSPSDASKYKILLIGDSFVWGVGILNHERYAHLLENKLNKIRPTKVVSISSPGWNSSEFRKYYTLATKNTFPDLTIFSLVHNDSLLSPYNRDDETFQKCQAQYPKTSPVIGIDLNQMIASNTPFTEVDKVFKEQHASSWVNPVNLCILNSNLANMPTTKALYFLTDDFGDNNLYTTYTESLQKYKKNIISASEGKTLKKYNYLWQKGVDIYKILSVSHKESHPNYLANQMFSDILVREISQNPLWQYNKEK